MSHICKYCKDPTDAPPTLKDSWSGPCDDCDCVSCEFYDVCCASDCESDCSDCFREADEDWERKCDCDSECDCDSNTREHCTDCFGANRDHCDYCAAKRRILSSAPRGRLSELRRMFRLFKPLAEIEIKAASKKRSSDEPGMLPQKKIRSE